MGYRFNDRPPRKPEDKLPIFDMFNNEMRTWSIPCFYLNVEKPIDWHDYKMHDHLGWPNPTKPGHICQALPDYEPWKLSPAAVWNYIDMNQAVKIHLKSMQDGPYESVVIAFDPFDEQGNAIDSSDIAKSGTIRTSEDWIVDLSFVPTLDSFAGKPKEFLFNSYLVGPQRKDLLVRAKLVVLPG